MRTRDNNIITSTKNTIHNDLCCSIMNFAPAIIIVNIVSEWLELKDLGKLDSSIVNHASRIKFLYHLSAYPSVKYNALNHKLNSAMVLTWATVRKMRWLKLSLRKCDAFPMELSVSCQQMTTLHLEECSTLTDDILVALLKKAPLLDLKLSNCELISDATLLALTSDDCLPLQLESLSIGHCAALSDTGLSAFAAKHCRVLQSFVASYCDFSAAGVGCMLEVASGTLRKVSCEQCVEVCGVANVLQSFVELTSLKCCVLEEFTIAHRDLMSMSQAVCCVGTWMPHVSALEANLLTPLALSVVEACGSKPSDDFQMVIRYIKGGVYPRPMKHTPQTAAAGCVSVVAVTDGVGGESTALC
jgi:hypothetical protein